eukprot:PITA_02874
MLDGEGVALYLTRLSQVRDELAAIDEDVPNSELVRTALKEFTEEWKPFIKGTIAQEKLPDSNRLAKGIMKISSTLKKFLKKCSMVASHLKKGIKEAWNLLFTMKKEVTKSKDEGLFSALTDTFQDENIWNSRRSIHWKKPNVDHLQILGCLVYIHIPKDKRKKLNPSGMRGTFVGYSNSSNAYRIYIMEGHRIEVSQDVIFDESIAFKKSKELPLDSDDEELPVFEEEVTREEEETNHENEGPSEPIQPVVIPKSRKRPN